MSRVSTQHRLSAGAFGQPLAQGVEDAEKLGGFRDTQEVWGLGCVYHGSPPRSMNASIRCIHPESL